jgi:hypothetical protein
MGLWASSLVLAEQMIDGQKASTPQREDNKVPPGVPLRGYEMTPERNDLTVVEQRIRAAKEYIYKQERLIEWLADEAKNTDDAFALLNILNRALRLFERHQLLLDRLGLSETEKDD